MWSSALTTDYYPWPASATSTACHGDDHFANITVPQDMESLTRYVFRIAVKKPDDHTRDESLDSGLQRRIVGGLGWRGDLDTHERADHTSDHSASPDFCLRLAVLRSSSSDFGGVLSVQAPPSWEFVTFIPSARDSSTSATFELWQDGSKFSDSELLYELNSSNLLTLTLSSRPVSAGVEHTLILPVYNPAEVDVDESITWIATTYSDTSMDATSTLDLVTFDGYRVVPVLKLWTVLNENDIHKGLADVSVEFMMVFSDPLEGGDVLSVQGPPGFTCVDNVPSNYWLVSHVRDDVPISTAAAVP